MSASWLSWARGCPIVVHAISLAELFPLADDVPEVETIRQRTLHVGARLDDEEERMSPAKCSVPPAEAMTVSIDGGHVRSARVHQGRMVRCLYVASRWQ